MTLHDLDQQSFIHAIEASNVAHTVSSVDGDFPLIYVNQAFLDQTGYTRDEVIGQNCRFLQGPETNPETIKILKASLLEEKPIDVEILNYTKSGQAFWNRLRMSPVHDEGGQLISFIGIQSDVTYIKEQEQERLNYEASKLRMVQRLLANLSHEIKNCIQPIKLMSELLRDMQQPDEMLIAKATKIISDNVQLSEQVLADMLLFSKNAEANLRDIGVIDLYGQIESFLSGVVSPDEARVSFSLDKTFSSKDSVHVNDHQLYQVMSNMVRNAIHADASTINIDFSKKSSCLCMSIFDNGRGIEPEIIGYIFDAFYSTKPVEKGTGLGLAISKTMIETMGGTITVDSILGQGACFEISIYLN